MTSWVREMVDTLPFERRRPVSTTPYGAGGGLVMIALVLGAGLMYLFDPELGARRRARLRTLLEDLGRRSGEVLQGASRDVLGGGARRLGVVRRATPPEAQSP
jgi:hypothetical protein